jgi:tRNA-binding EMAP/Myf-like protein
MKGFVSHGMVLCAKTDDGKVEFADPPAGAAIGERITVGSLVSGEPDEQVNPSKKNNPWLAIVEHLKTDAKKVACYQGIPMMTSSGPVTAPTLANATLS